mmetsp:Transcript_115134/g.326178  ORF Transcript_115134/g.326178 Transcript_115134/m.326178 type:complete len:208 (+) Transcript_115134:485-1108(+)
MPGARRGVVLGGRAGQRLGLRAGAARRLLLRARAVGAGREVEEPQLLACGPALGGHLLRRGEAQPHRSGASARAGPARPRRGVAPRPAPRRQVDQHRLGDSDDLHRGPALLRHGRAHRDALGPTPAHCLLCSLGRARCGRQAQKLRVHLHRVLLQIVCESAAADLDLHRQREQLCHGAWLKGSRVGRMFVGRVAAAPRRPAPWARVA